MEALNMRLGRKKTADQADALPDQTDPSVVSLHRGYVAPRDMNWLVQASNALLDESDQSDHFGMIRPAPDGQHLLFCFGKSARPEQHMATSLPLTQIRHNFGTFSIYSPNSQSFVKKDLEVIKSLGIFIAKSIESALFERELARQRHFSETLLETGDALVLLLTPEGHIDKWNRACGETTGFNLSDIKGRPFVAVCGAPEERTVYEDAFAQLFSGRSPARFTSYILTREGRRRTIQWVFTHQIGEDGAVQALLGTGIDTTETHQACGQLASAMAEVDEAKQALEALEAQVRDAHAAVDAAAGQGEAAKDDETEDDKGGKERRTCPRHPYRFKQLVAPSPDGQMPVANAFREVQCRDLSSHGFSYVTSQVPDSEQIVVAFGKPSSLLHLTAVIRHTTAFGQDRNDTYLVGCEFTGRLTDDH